MALPRALILTGYGINCDEETAYAFELAGAQSRLVHVNDLIAQRGLLAQSQILAVPGGFSYGDDTGSGNALANKLRVNLMQELLDFVRKDRLVLGICNGFQVLANLGLLPALDGKSGERSVALTHNDSARYVDRWVDLEFSDIGLWSQGIGRASMPVAHGEGKFYADAETLKKINERGLVAVKYVYGDVSHMRNPDLNYNPNGSLEDIAGITDESGKVFGLMPHPERAVYLTQHPLWTLMKDRARREGRKLKGSLDGLKIFRNGVEYFK